MEEGMLWRNGCDGKVLRCGAGDRHQHLHLQQAPPHSTLKGVFVAMWMGHGALKLTARPQWAGLMGSVAAQSRPRLVEGACALGFIPIGVVRGVFKMTQGRPTRQVNINLFLEGQGRLN